MKPPLEMNIRWGYRDLVSDSVSRTVVILKASLPKDPTNLVSGLRALLRDEELFLSWRLGDEGWRVIAEDLENKRCLTVLKFEFDRDNAMQHHLELREARRANGLWRAGCMFLLVIGPPEFGVWFNQREIFPAAEGELTGLASLLFRQPAPDYRTLAIWSESSP